MELWLTLTVRLSQLTVTVVSGGVKQEELLVINRYLTPQSYPWNGTQVKYLMSRVKSTIALLMAKLAIRQRQFQLSTVSAPIKVTLQVAKL